MHVNFSVTVKIVGGISICDGGKLEEPEGYNYFFVVFYALIEIDQLLCVICWVINHSWSVSCKYTPGKLSQVPPRRYRLNVCDYQCTKINRFVCKISAFRTKNDRSFSVSGTSVWLRSHFKGRAFGKYGKFWGIWCVTKLYAYKGRIALFDFQ